jgi:hypothetical protein
LLPEEPSCSGFDYVFYGYDGFRGELLASAAEFRQFLEVVLTQPWKLWRDIPHQSARPESHYKEVVLVCHSLGAVVVRRALLDLTMSGSVDTSIVKLVLFAPAHRGAHLARLFIETFTGAPLFNLFAGLARFTSPLVDQLHPGSKELEGLLTETQTALSTAKYPQLSAQNVFIATLERIVTNVSFCQDSPPIPIEGNHVSICKPTDEYSASLGQLVKAVRAKAAGVQ